MPDIVRNGYGWVSLWVSRELLRLIFPKYPDTSEVRSLPQWVQDKLGE